MLEIFERICLETGNLITTFTEAVITKQKWRFLLLVVNRYRRIYKAAGILQRLLGRAVGNTGCNYDYLGCEYPQYKHRHILR